MTAPKAKRGRPKGSIKLIKSIAPGEKGHQPADQQEPLSNFQKPRARVPADDEVDQPTIPGVEEDHVPIPQLEKKFKLMQQAQDEAKRANDRAAGFEEECLLILSDHGLDGKPYKRKGVFIFIVRGKPHVKGNLDHD